MFNYFLAIFPYKVPLSASLSLRCQKCTFVYFILRLPGDHS